jgi:4a-hydroxytetrahydrobiopterin dehydratase
MKWLSRYGIIRENSNWIENSNRLQKVFQFENFTQSLNFINAISEVCESEKHHPDIYWKYNKIQLNLTTHDKGDTVTEKDHRLAELIDEVFNKL